MPKTKVQKQAEIQLLEEALRSASSVVLAEFHQVSVKEMDEFRKKAREQGVRLRVVKNNLLNLVLKNLGLSELNLKKIGKMLMLFVPVQGQAIDEAVIPKLVFEIGKKSLEKVKLFAGLMDGKKIEAELLEKLAQIPGKQELYAQMIGSLNAPAAGFVNSLAGVIRNFVFAIKAISESSGR